MTPTLFAAFVFLAAMMSSDQNMPRTLMVCCLFGASAAIELPSLGGAPITPAIFLLPFLVWRALRREGPNACMQHLAYPQAGFWLLLLVLWGVLSALFLPRLFAGDTLIYGSDRGVIQGVRLLPLQPMSTNITQSLYAVASLSAFVAVKALLHSTDRMVRFRDAVLLLASLNCAAAVLNLIEIELHITGLLELVRNAGYAIMVGGEIGGLQRISGTFAETSAFSAFTLPLLAFSASLWRERVRPGYSGSVALLSLLLLLFSTSSTAYASLAVYGVLLAAAALWKNMSHAQSPRLGIGTVLLWMAAVAVCIVLLIRPEIATRVGDFFSITLVRKLESSSGIERNSWNMQAWANFLDVHGVGVGLGSARGSSYVLVLLSNLGVLGTALFLTFVARLLMAPAEPIASEAEPVVRAARHAVIAAVIAASISAAVFDLGLAFYAFAAAAATRVKLEESRVTQRGAHVTA